MSKIAAFVLLIVADAAVGQAHLLISGDDVYGASLLIQQLMLAAFVFYLIDYKLIAFKSLAFIFATSELLDVFSYLEISNNITSALLSIVLFVPWMTYAIWRTYDTPSVTPKKDTVYYLSKKPDNFWGFIPSLFTGTSGYSILCNGVRYGFRHGRYTITDFNEPENDYRHITSAGINLTEEVLQYLHSKRGATWKPYDNCMTVHIKLKYLEWKCNRVY